MERTWHGWPARPAYLGVPLAATALLCIGALAAALNGRPTGMVVGLCALVVLVTSALTEPKAAIPVAVIAWMTASSFARAPFGSFHPTTRHAAYAAGWSGGSAAVGVAVGVAARWSTRAANASTLEPMGLAAFAAAVDRRRQAWGWALAATLLPVVTLILTSLRAHLSLTDNLLIYLLAVVAVAVVGGFWPAVFAAIAASLLINWYFTRPFHTFTIARPDNLLSLLLFIVVAIAVSSVVHLAARRLILARRAQAESEALARLARSVLGGEDTPAVVLRHLHNTLIVGAELLEKVGGRWVRAAYCGDVSSPRRHRLLAREDISLVVYGDLPDGSERLLEAAAGQAAAALDRDRLRTQAAQAEALAAGNRMRTALLAAVSHDLRTPLASIKASITSLRQPDMRWSPEDEAALLETIEQSSDRLDSLIANLLDMSRVQTGALQPYLRPAAVDEIAPLALRGIDRAEAVVLDVPEVLPLILTDAGLLERALANLIANAVRFSPPGRPAELSATAQDDAVEIKVIDHGPGIAHADRERIFEPFQRLGDQDPSTGVGLGLAVARGFIEAIGGELRPSDTPGGGLTMTATLPTAPMPARLPRRRVDS